MESKLVLSPDDSTLFYTAVNSAGKGVLCKFLVSGTLSECIQLGRLEDITTLLYVDATHFFITARDTAAGKPVITMLEWNNITPAWQNLRNCTKLFCYVKLGSVILSSDSSMIYSIFSHNL